MFSTAHADAINTLQLLMKALTQLQRAAQNEGITAALQVCGRRAAQCPRLLRIQRSIQVCCARTVRILQEHPAQLLRASAVSGTHHASHLHRTNKKPLFVAIVVISGVN
jgi:hypothetical protein